MKILVTGATGFLGRHVCEELMVQGHNVFGLGRNIEIGAKLKEKGVNFVAGNLEDSKLIQSLVSNVNAVIHCGSLSAAWGKYRDFYSANVIGTKNIVNACLQHNVYKLIHISSSSVYFDNCNKVNIIETTTLPQKAHNNYIATKVLAEKVVENGISNGLRAIILRPRGIFGPYDCSIFPTIIAAAKTGSFPLINNGKALVDLTYVENVVQAITCALHASSKYNGSVYNITNGESKTISELLNLLFCSINLKAKHKSIPYKIAYYTAHFLELISTLKYWSNTPPKYTRYTIGLLTFDQTLDISKARNELGYSPEISIPEGIQKYAKWWLTNG